MAEAIGNYDRFVVCLDKAPDDCVNSLQRLMEKAIKAYVNREPGLRHGISLDRQITVILSQTEGDRPMCAIYFNLFSPYHQKKKKTASTPQD